MFSEPKGTTPKYQSIGKPKVQTYYLSIDYALHILPHQVKRNSFFRESKCFFNWKVNEESSLRIQQVCLQSCEIQQKVFPIFDSIFHVSLTRRLQKYARNLIPTIASCGQTRQGKKMMPDWLDWLSYFAGSSKSHLEISMSCIFLKSSHQVQVHMNK